MHEAGQEYHAIVRTIKASVSADRDALAIYAAVCDFKLKHIGRRDVERLPETTDDTAALKLYMLAEISRNEKNEAEHDGHHRRDGQALSHQPLA